MKRMRNLYDRITPNFILEMIERSSAKKRKRPDVMNVLNNKEACADKIYWMLVGKNFEFNKHIECDRYDPHSKKTRHLMMPRYYPDHIIHWCYVQMMMPLFRRGMYQHTYGSIPGRGPGRARRQVRAWIDKDTHNTQYVMEADIRKFYESIPQDKLIASVRRVCADKDAMWLTEKIIHSVPSGLPIGDYFSPWLGNFYLQGLDHYIKEVCHVKYYIRYMDNLLLFSESKEHLQRTMGMVTEYIHGLGLSFNSSRQVYPLEPRGVDFLGVVFHKDYSKMRARNFLAFTRQARVLRGRVDSGEEISLHEAMSIGCRVEVVKRGNCYNILNKYFPDDYIMEMRRITSKMMKKRNAKGAKKNEVYPT